MSQYKNLTMDSVCSFSRLFDRCTRELKRNPTDYNLRLFVLYLYEFILVHGVFKLKYKYEAQGKKTNIKLTDLDKFISEYDFDILLELKHIADSVRHTPAFDVAQRFFCEYYELKSKDIIRLYGMLLPSGSEALKLLSDANSMNRIKNSLTLLVDKENAVIFVKKCLEIDSTSKRSKYTLAQTTTLLCRKFGCSNDIAIKIIFDVVKDNFMD